MNSEIKSNNIFGNSALVLFGFCAVVFAVVRMITFRDYGDGSWLCRTNWFWWRILWFEVIFTLFWFAIFGVSLSRLLQSRHMTGATYTVVTAICLRASLVSFVIWCISSFVPTDSPFAVFPVAIQLIVILYYGVVSYMFPKTQALQLDGMMRPQELGVVSPAELANKLEHLEQKLGTSADAAIVKKVKERIRYSLPMVGRIVDSSAYRKLVEEVIKMIENPDSDISRISEELSPLISQSVEFCKQQPSAH